MRGPGIVVAALVTGAIGIAAQAAPTFAAVGEPAPVAPTVSTGMAEGITQSTATLTGMVDTGGYQTKYEFDLGADTGYGVRIFGNAGFEPGAQMFAVPLADLMPGTTYHYRIVATNIFGTSDGVDQTFTTSVDPSTMLTSPATIPLLPAPVLAPEPTVGDAKVASASAAQGAQVAGTHHGAGKGHASHGYQRHAHKHRGGARKGRGRG
ncbi:MAG TPA: hypothetical protein VNV42_03415 [Solirubrobacteraceae bacterium]|jgi:hypothetical protein|nr:hypothetical protein [Solirubrobacteraceae bacterium]